MQNRSRALLFVSVLVLAALSCNFLQNGAPVAPPAQSNDNEAPSAELPTSVPEPAEKVLFEDDFSNRSNDWDEESSDTGVTDFADDGYRIFVNETMMDYWANPNEYFEGDVDVTVEATKVAGPDQNDFGVLCRYTQDASANTRFFYAFLISSDGKAGIYKVSGNDSTFLNDSGTLDIEVSAIKTGDATNTIRATCIGSELSLYVNDTFVVSVTDSEFTDGDIGLIAGSFDTAGVDILFDNIMVVQP